jgi:hypothetical protein
MKEYTWIAIALNEHESEGLRQEAVMFKHDPASQRMIASEFKYRSDEFGTNMMIP